ncbi:MAG TPA: DUF995 domain-containing protein [Albitalea sp.]|jgi:hypothetical protein|nr:DUF995 domain-containing protein [Albitalea sp.]
MTRRHGRIVVAVALSLPTLVVPALAQDAAVMRDLEAKSPKVLSKADLEQLLPGAKMSRVTAGGNAHFWSNDSGGSFIISSDNRDRGGPSSTAPGTWHISDDGRYCVLLNWKKVATEEWCRYIVQTSDGYYATKSDKTGTEKVYKLEIKK